MFGVNSHRENAFANAYKSRNYQFALGLFEYVEINGRLAEYPRNAAGDLGTRDLSANIKLALPKLFAHQPDIAVGMNDIGGGAPLFRSRYIAVSDTFGPLRVTLGAARGQAYLSRAFGGAELDLWNSGVSALVERTDGTSFAGLRYRSGPLARAGDAAIVVSMQHSFGARTLAGASADRSSLALQLSIPLDTRSRVPARQPAAAAVPASAPVAAAPASAQATASAPVAQPAIAPAPTTVAELPASPVQQAADASAPAASADTALARVRAELIKAGLERVRVGRAGKELVIEYENHRYNQNEVDAVGIVLGVGAVLAPTDISTVSAVSKKAGLAIFKASVDRAGYRQFMRDGEAFEVRQSVTLQYRPGNGAAVQWQDQEEGPRGYSRIRIDPQLVKFVGTELGVFDYSLAANIQAIVPLWKGAELTTSYITTLAESDNVAHGFFGYAQQRNGLKSAVVSQAVWLSDSVLNVTSAGKYLYGDRGIQNETIWMVPGRDDQLRVQYTRTRHTDRYRVRDTDSGGASYLWNYAPLSVWVEAGYNQYLGGDRGPFLQVSRWFGDLQAQMYMRKSDLETRIGFGLAIPLTPRQGMRPGLTHLEGASSYPFKLETKYARRGECNCITQGVLAEMGYVYNARMNLLNQGRLGKDYFAGQLQRMREAALLYAPDVQ